MVPGDREYLLGVRNGLYTLQECLTRVGELERELKDLEHTSPIRNEPDVDAVEKWMLKKYFYCWSAQRRVHEILEVEQIRASLATN
jgi:hypothetical protein